MPDYKNIKQHAKQFIKNLIFAKHSYLENGCLVLLYPTINNSNVDSNEFHIDKKKFEKHVSYLKKNYKVISLLELISILKEKRPLNKHIVITSEDEIKNFSLNALPILENYKISATLFVSSDYFKISNNNDIETISFEDFEQLIKSPFIEIGAHMNNHCASSNKSINDHKLEIFESKRTLEEVLKIPIQSFSYPYKNKIELCFQTINNVKEEGFSSGITHFQGIVYHETDPFCIPRFTIKNWTVPELEYHLGRFVYQYEFNISLKAKQVLSKLPFVKTFFKWKLKNSTEIGSEIITEANKTLTNELYPKLNIQTTEPQKLSVIKNILFINTLDTKGGAAKIANQLHHAFKTKEISSVFFAKKKFTNDESIDLIYRENKELFLQYSKQFKLPNIYNLSSLEIIKKTGLLNADIVHFHNLQDETLNPFLIPEITNRKHTIWTLHDMYSFTGNCSYSLDCEKWLDECGCCPLIKNPHEKDQTHYLWDLKKQIYNKSKLTIVCPSQWLKEKVEKSILKYFPIHLIYNGVDTTIFYPRNKEESRKVLNLPLNKKILLFTADTAIKNPWKGGEIIQETYKQLSNQREFVFVNIGGNTKIHSDNWIEIPYVSDENVLAQYYSAADLFIYPSLADNCPLVVLESLACGTPIVSFNTGGIPELIQHNKNGYIAEYNNTYDFIKGIEYLCHNPKLIEEFSKNAVNSINENFTVDLMVGQYLKLYNSFVQI